MAAHKAKKMCVITNKGGVLKSTLTSNLAALYSLRGERVLIVDMDNQGNQALSFGLDPNNYLKSIYNVLVDGIHPQNVIVNLYKEMEKLADDEDEIPRSLRLVDLLPSNDAMTSFEFKILRNPNTQEYQFDLLKMALEKIENQYDVIIIDSPPNLGLTAGNVLVASDQVIIPFHPEPFSMRSLVTIIDTIEDFKEDMEINATILGIIGTKLKEGTNMHPEIMANCRQFGEQLGIHVFDTVIPESVKGAGTVHYEYIPNVLSKMKKVKDLKKLQTAYRELFAEILEEQEKKGAVLNG